MANEAAQRPSPLALAVRVDGRRDKASELLSNVERMQRAKQAKELRLALPDLIAHLTKPQAPGKGL
jgi:hypothetical protein